MRKVDIPAMPPTRVKTTHRIAEATPVPNKKEEKVIDNESSDSKK